MTNNGMQEMWEKALAALKANPRSPRRPTPAPEAPADPLDAMEAHQDALEALLAEVARRAAAYREQARLALSDHARLTYLLGGAEALETLEKRLKSYHRTSRRDDRPGPGTEAA